MTSIGIDRLCDTEVWAGQDRLRRLYLPFGAALALVRLALLPGLTAIALILPPRLRPCMFRIFLGLMGLVIRCNLDRVAIGRHVEGRVVASNHVSLLDALTVIGLPFTTVMAGDPHRQANRLTLVIGLMAGASSGGRFWTIRDRRDLVRRLKQWKAQPAGTALYIAPETTINNGRGLFAFLPDLLCRGMPVVPLAVKLTTPFGLVPHPINQPGLLIAFRLLMMPWLRFDLAYLPAMTQQPGQSDMAFAGQVQSVIADHLGIPATGLTRADKHAYRRSLQARAMLPSEGEVLP